MTALHPAPTYWSASAGATGFPPMSGDLAVDIAIIGGGIVGITTARLLKDAGLTVAVLEAHRVGGQVTGKSTAKISSQHGTIYQTLESKFGESQARLYGAAQEGAIRRIRELAAQHGIDCDLVEQSAYLYTRDAQGVAKLEKEFDAAQRLGLPATLVRQTDLPYPVLAALRFDAQAQFHPIKYVAGLARTLPGGGSHVFEHTCVLDWEPQRIITQHGSVRARHVVMATHLPLGQVGLYYAQAYAQAEPVIAAPMRRPPQGMYLSVDTPSHSLRTHTAAYGTVYAIAAGNSFKPGHTDDERQSFADLERWLLTSFDAAPVQYRWVNEDYSAMDGAPFIGWSSSPDDGYLVATGFNAWGITNGTVAAAVIADLVAGRESPWTDAFPPSRIKPLAGGPKFVQETLETAAHLVGGYLARRPTSYDELAPGDAAIMQIDGKKVAAYRDEAGALHAVSAVCTHMGCILGWNECDRTWDCPCHGSRFDLQGEVLHGPAVRPLARHGGHDPR